MSSNDDFVSLNLAGWLYLKVVKRLRGRKIKEKKNGGERKKREELTKENICEKEKRKCQKKDQLGW